jgi:hypothetical protein
MTAAAAAELARLATCGREGGGEGEWEDDEAARGGGEDALRAEGDGMDYCVASRRAGPVLGTALARYAPPGVNHCADQERRNTGCLRRAASI